MTAVISRVTQQGVIQVQQPYIHTAITLHSGAHCRVLLTAVDTNTPPFLVEERGRSAS